MEGDIPLNPDDLEDNLELVASLENWISRHKAKAGDAARLARLIISTGIKHAYEYAPCFDHADELIDECVMFSKGICREIFEGDDEGEE